MTHVLTSLYRLVPDFNRAIEIDIPIVQAGAFAFYTTYTPLPEFSNKDVETPKPTKTATYYFDVAPRLTLQNSPLPINALAIISVLSKFMGKYPEQWDKHLQGIGQRGYNMVHFAPLMQRGDSNSPYSLYDMHTFDPEHFPIGEKDVAEMIKKMEEDYGLLGLTDVVLNHTANNSKWLESHPECGYNLETAPWLESAYELDTALLKLGEDLGSLGLPTTLNSRDDLNKIIDTVKNKVFSDIKLWEYYVLDVERDTKAAVEAWKSASKDVTEKLNKLNISDAKNLGLKGQAEFLAREGLRGDDRLGERFRKTVDPQVSAALLNQLFGSHNKSSDEHGAQEAIHNILNELNSRFYPEFDTEKAVILDQLSGRIAYLRLEGHGPQMGEISAKSPLIESYFTRLPKNEITKSHNPRSLALANNGWIWAADAMKDNAGPTSRAYLRREVIVWGDCVKLRYGKSAEDSPFLWKYMGDYVRLMAKYFAAFRIDNCHSTPIHVAEYMLDQARQVRPNLAIFAELFSGSESMDFVFVKRLGLSALIREAMQANSTAEISRLVHMHGGIPIGSFDPDESTNADKALEANGGTNGAKPQEVVHRIRQSDVHALFFDCTHDNETPAQKRDARDTLPNAALVAMCACATGSVFGYDEVYPALIELVHETRLYTSISSEGQVTTQAGEGGIGGIKKLLNQIHILMGKDGYDETYIDHKDQYVTVHRVHPQSRKGYFLIAHTAYPGYGNGNGGFAPVHLPGTRAKSIGSWRLEADVSQETKDKVINDKQYLRGLPASTKDTRGLKVENQGDDTTIIVPEAFPPGSIALFETWVPSAEHSEGLDKYVTTGARAAFKDLKLRDLNFVLYRADGEEKDMSGGKDGVYTIPNHGPLVYAGLQGWWSVLRDVIRDNDLGHPICEHLRQGHWALDYCVNRLQRLAKLPEYERLKVPAKWLHERFEAIRKIPTFLLPRYFAKVIQTAYNAAVDRAIEQMSDNIRYGPSFLKELALVSVQLSGITNSASLYPHHQVPCLAAGLPHFAADWARCWGRDVMISLRGLLLATGRFGNAKEHILAFGSVLKHGMIPNLLGSGKITRYNSRDSIWFFLQCIQDYTTLAPNGLDILKEVVKRRFFPYDDTWFAWDDERAYTKTSSIEDIIQEAMQRHATGMSFREANAGPGIDSQMKDPGFNIDIHVDWSNGILFGGNQWNCGTWMDKMGESEKAGSKGFPGTPRDGAAIEITGMLYSTLVWLDKLSTKGQYQYKGVKKTDGEFISWKDWAALLKENFERCYWIPEDPSEDSKHDVNSHIINRRGIYKDLYKSGKEYEDYQLRANAPIAMTVAPDLFVPEHALKALHMVDAYLRSPYGIATLDPSDLNYRGTYDNSLDNDDFRTAKGRSYHQ